MDKLPPHDLDSEESVLGSCLIDDSALFKILDLLKPADFYRDKNEWVFQAIMECYKRREAINQVTVAYELRRVGRIEALGGPDYLSNLILNVPTAVHIEHYARIVKRLAKMRSLITAGMEIENIGYESPPDEDVAVSRAVGTVLKYTKDSNDGCKPISDITEVAWFDSMAMINGEKLMPGISTGFKRLDYAIGGWQKGLFTVIAGRPAIGKTNTALASLMVCSKPDAKGVLFSLESPKERIVTRMAYMQAGVNEVQLQRDIRLNKLTPEMVEDIKAKVTDGFRIVHDMPILIEAGRMSVVQLEAKIRRLQAEHEIGVVFVDHLGKLVDGIDQQRYQRISSISNKLSNMCLVCNVPIIALCQLSRDPESSDRKKDRKPRMSDLRDSGIIEEDARIILGLYRESYYNDEARLPDLLECIVLKYSEGESFTNVPLRYEKTSRRIFDWPREDEYLLVDKPADDVR